MTEEQRAFERDSRSDCTLSPELWSHFVEHHWDKRPLLLKRPLDVPLVSGAEAFLGLVEASDRFRAGARKLPLQFYEERGFLLTGPRLDKYLPEASDATVTGYAERVTRMLGGQRFAFVLNGNVFAHEAAAWRRARRFLRGLFREIPMQSSYCAVFFGNYEGTPFGVHKDDKSNFQFVIEGKKRMHLWPEEVVRSEPGLQDAFDYRRFLDRAITLEGGPGDVLFWPASYWHIGESVEGLSLSVTVGLRPFAAGSADVWQHIARKIEARLGELPAVEGEDPTTAVIALAEDVLRQAGGDPDLATALKIASLERRSNHGSVDAPPLRPARPLTDDDLVRGSPEDPILWLPAEEEGHAICSANGHSFVIPAAPGVLCLLSRLNAGEVMSVRGWADAHAGTTQVEGIDFEVTREGVRALLEKLYRLRAITID